MTAKFVRRKRDRRKETNQADQAKHEPQPVMAETVLFVSEESVGHVENFFQPTDVDQKRPIRKVEAKPPVLDPDEKWVGDASSDEE
jgi:hypothetical protein